MNMTAKQVAKEALASQSEAPALLANRLVETLDLAEDDGVRQLWIYEACRRRDGARSGRVTTTLEDEASASVRRLIGR